MNSFPQGEFLPTEGHDFAFYGRNKGSLEKSEYGDVGENANRPFSVHRSMGFGIIMLKSPVEKLLRQSKAFKRPDVEKAAVASKTIQPLTDPGRKAFLFQRNPSVGGGWFAGETGRPGKFPR